MRVSVDYGWCWFGLGFNAGKLQDGVSHDCDGHKLCTGAVPAVHALELYLGPWCVTVTW